MRTAFAAIALLVLGTVAAIELPPPQAPAHIGQTDATVGFNTAVGGKAAGSESEPEKCREHYEYSSVFKKCLPQNGFDGYVGQPHQQQQQQPQPQPQQQPRPSEVHGARLTQNPGVSPRSSIARLMGVAPIRIAPLQSRVSNQPLIAGQNRFITSPDATGQQTGQSSCPAGFVMRKGLCVAPQQAIRRGRSNENQSDDDDNNRNDDDDNNNNNDDDDSDEAELQREQRARRFRSRFPPFAVRSPFMGRAGMYGESAPRFMGFRPFGGVRPQITIPTIVIVLPPLPSGRAERNATAHGERNETDTATPVAVAGPAAASPAAVVAPRATAVADKVAAKLGKKIDTGIDKVADKVAAKVEEKVGGGGGGAADEKPAAAEETTPKKEESDNDASSTSSSSSSSSAPDQAKVTEAPRESDLPNSNQSKPSGSDSESTSSSTAPSTSSSSSSDENE